MRCGLKINTKKKHFFKLQAVAEARTLWSEKTHEVDMTARAIVHVHQFSQFTRVHIGDLEYLAVDTVHRQVRIITVDDTCNNVLSRYATQTFGILRLASFNREQAYWNRVAIFKVLHEQKLCEAKGYVTGSILIALSFCRARHTR